MNSLKRSSLKISFSRTVYYVFLYVLLSSKCGNSMEEQCYQPSCCYISPKKLLPPKEPQETCFTDTGQSYRGTLARTKANQGCMNWMDTVFADISPRKKQKYGIGDHNYCRNPEPTESRGPWCYIKSRNYGYCDITSCSTYPEIEYSRLVKSPICEAHPEAIGHPDVIFKHQNLVYYVTMYRGNNYLRNYVAYAFENDKMTAFSKPPSQTLNEALNLCLRTHDVITFVTSSPEGELYLYMQVPHVMLKIDLQRKGWRKVQQEVFQKCVSPARQSARVSNKDEETIIKSIFDFKKPDSIFLEVNSVRLECAWQNGSLVAVSKGKAEFETCEKTSAIFIDNNNVAFEVVRNTRNNGRFSGNDYLTMKNSTIITNLREAIHLKPGLAAPLLGYEILNAESLVKIAFFDKTFNNSFGICFQDGVNSRMFQVYNGNQLSELIQWLKSHDKLSVEVNVNSVETRRAGFCQTNEAEDGCCAGLLSQYRHQRNSGQLGSRLTNGKRLLWITCRISFPSQTDHDDSCPTISCFQNQPAKLEKPVYTLCEIRLSPDPPVHNQISLGDILGVKEGEEIHYADAFDASMKLGEIANSIRRPSNSDNLELDVLIGSIKALQPVNYTELSNEDTKQLISDFVMVVDDIADQKRIKDWIKPDEDFSEEHWRGSATLAQDSAMNKTKTKRKEDPHSLLFITENVLQQVVSGGTVWNDVNETITVTTQNVISTMEQKLISSNISESQRNGKLNVSVSSSSADPNQPSVVITSLFPNIISVITEVYEKDSSYKTCENGRTCASENQLHLQDSPVLSTTVMQNNKKISSSINFTMPYNDTSLPDPLTKNRKYYFTCSYLSKDNEWVSRGCQVTGVDVGERLVRCSCNHTTNFAILLQVIPPKIKDDDVAVLSLISYIGESLSVFCLIVTMVVLAAFRHSLKSERIVAHFHLVIALILFHLIQLFSYNAEELKATSVIPCVIVVFTSHYSLLAAFMWMLCEGITLHFSVVDVFHKMKRFKLLRYFVGWGIPLLIAIGSLLYGLSMKPYPTCYLQGVGEQSCLHGSGKHHGTSDADPAHQLIERCWLSTESHLVWALVIPVIFVLSLNLVVLIRVTLLISKSSKAANVLRRPSSERKDTDFSHIRKSVKGVAILMPILGIPWFFGLIPQSLTHVFFLYIFTALNSAQGVFILLFYCILNNEVRTVISRCIRKRRLLQQQTWNSQGNCKNNSADLRHMHKSADECEQTNSFRGGFQRSISTNTTDTYAGGFSLSKRSHSIAGPSGERSTLFQSSLTTYFQVSRQSDDSNNIPSESENTTTLELNKLLYEESQNEELRTEN